MLVLRAADERYVFDEPGEFRFGGAVQKKMQPGETLALTAVRASSVIGRVVDRERRAVANAFVQLRQASRDYPLRVSATNARGEFSFNRLDGLDA